VANAYRAKVTEGVAEELRRMGPQVSKPIGYAIRKLEEDPRPSGCKKLRGTNRNAPDLYRIHVDVEGGATFRVIYSIDNAQVMVVVVAVRRKTAHTYGDLPALQRMVQEFLQSLDEGF
jgi:mRNA interferase RelE/StbE